MDAQVRQTAIKTKISHIINGSYVVKEGWEPNYVLYKGQNISRINIMGAVVSKNQNEMSNNVSITVDDGSGRISVRSFENDSTLDKVSIGQIILLIGRPREYGNEIYIVPEIVKTVENTKWVDVRRLELGDDPEEQEAEPEEDAKEDIAHSDHPKKEIIPEQEAKEDKGIIDIIKNLDKGDGADFDDVIASLKENNPEEIVSNLLKNGDIFELRPGKLKVLE